MKNFTNTHNKQISPNKRKLFTVFLLILVLGLSACSGNKSKEETIDTSENYQENTAEPAKKDSNKDSNNQKEESKITYTEISADELVDDLSTNALKASKKYKGKYVKVSGRLAIIDSDGAYIELDPQVNQHFSLASIKCYTDTEELKNSVAELEKDETVTVSGKIVKVDGSLGYTIVADKVASTYDEMAAKSDEIEAENYRIDHGQGSNPPSSNTPQHVVPSAEAAMEADYILPTSDTEVIDVQLLQEMYDDVPELIQLAINEIYARHGYKFSTKEYADFFSQKSWYHPVDGLTTDYIQNNLLNKAEITNIQNMTAVRERNSKK